MLKIHLIIFKYNKLIKAMKIIQVSDDKKIPKAQYIINENFFDTVDWNDPNNPLSDNDEDLTGINKIVEEEHIKPKVVDWLKQQCLGYREDDDKIIIECTGKGIIVNIKGNLILSGRKLEKFPKLFRFGKVDGNLNVSNNRFASFEWFPKEICGNLLANDNYLKDFTNAPTVKGEVYAERQKLPSYYKLNTENYLKWKNGENLFENLVYSEKFKEYGKLIGINENEGVCTISLNEKEVVCNIDEVEVVNSIEYIKEILK